MAVLIAVRDLVFRSKIEAVAQRLNVPVVTAPRGQPLADAVRALMPRTVVVDLGEPGMVAALEGVRQLAPNLRIVAYVGHLRVDLAEAARAVGAEVFTRGQLAGRLDEILTRPPDDAPEPAP